MAALKKSLKRNTLRYVEYYDLTSSFDKLYADSKLGKVFTNLMEEQLKKLNKLRALARLPEIA